jgi:hypothetical protein
MSLSGFSRYCIYTKDYFSFCFSGHPSALFFAVSCLSPTKGSVQAQALPTIGHLHPEFTKVSLLQPRLVLLVSAITDNAFNRQEVTAARGIIHIFIFFY